ncbi:MAG TPA: hypothetical protein VM734_03245 [Kofleriaceae bacterium]|nr:hypothetical protein [Kofleriaceae bacterium]
MKVAAVDGTALLRWVELDLPEPPWDEHEPFVGFVYLDAQAGLSAKGGRKGDPDHVERPGLTVRLPIGVPGRVLPADEARARGLPERPGWLVHYGAQPPADAPWRTDPALRGRFHRSFPDDLQVLIHDGEPRRTGTQTELCWLRVVAAEDAAGRTVYVGQLLSKPHQLATVAQGDRLRFLPAPGGRYPLYVTAAYLAERAGWKIEPCSGCGLTETLDPPSVMARTRFPDVAAGSEPVMFTAHCAACQGTQVVTKVQP